MKKIFILIIIALAAIPATVGAQSSSKQKTQKKPVNVIKILDEIIINYATENGESYEKIKNPNTNTIESFERIVNFSLPNTHSNILKLTGQAFQEDEELSFRLSHMVPRSGDLVNLKVITDNGNKRKSLRIRKNGLQEMWLMCCKNVENPQFRDAYAIVWEKRNDKVFGTIYMITSLRPDRFSGKSLITSQGVVAEPDSCAPVASNASEKKYFEDLEVANKWYSNLDYVKKATFESELQKITYKTEIIKEKYKRIPQLMNIINGTESRKTSWKNVDGIFKSIKEGNAQIDKDIEGLISTMNSWQCPPEALLILHSRVVKEFLNLQTMIFNELCANYGSLSKTAQKCQKYISTLTEKHIKCGETYILYHLGME